MSYLRGLPPTAALAALLLGSSLRAQEQPPQELPTRDVDISYQITRPQQPTIMQRRRWLASEHLVRVDGAGKSATIYDRNAREITVLNLANRTYLKLEGAPRLPLDPEKGETWPHFFTDARVADDPTEGKAETYEPVTCTACTQVHLVNPNTGKVLGLTKIRLPGGVAIGNS